MASNPTFTAGDPIRAVTLRARLPVLGVTASDISMVSSTVMADVPGLVVDLEPFALYAFDGYIAYSAGTTGDILLRFTYPLRTTGHWFLAGQAAATTTGTGAIEFLRASIPDVFGFDIGAAGSGAMAVQPHGYLTTGAFPGPLQWQFSQVATSATATTVVAGSWIRAHRLN